MSILKDFIYRLRGEYTTERLIKMGLKVGNNFKRLNGVILDPSHCWLITIGDNVTLAPRVHILAHDASTKEFLNYTKIGRVNIGNNVFIGAESVILPNITIGDNIIIGANSTVTKDIPSNSVYAGSPAKFICTVDEYIKKNKENMKNSPIYGDEYTIRKKIDNEKKYIMYNDLKNKFGYID
ncbi:MAG: acyltransferase [Intestinibacter bartlettii]|uniref:acyltransferase n=1 Tax=Intestinibacter bartlettii TaxID=261299 RepID=UPI00399966F1